MINFYKKLFLFIVLFTLTVSCSSLENAGKILRNEKISNTDEFLIEKKKPLVLPPDLEQVPEPGKIKEAKEDENSKEKIKDILKTSKESGTNDTNSDTEKSILNRIRR